MESSEVENLGAAFYKLIDLEKTDEYLIVSDSLIGKKNNILGYFLHGIKLKSYEFKKNIKQKKTIKS